MKQYSKKLFSLLALSSTVALAVDTPVLPYIQWRSQGRDTSRKLEGTFPYHIWQDDMETMYGTFNATFQYDRSFRQHQLAEALFGNSLVSGPNNNTTGTSSCNSDCDDSSVIVISGTAATPVNVGKDLMAENFLLPRDFQSTISFKPRVQNFLVDFDWYMGLDRWVKGLYFRLYGPVVSNKQTLHAVETNIKPGSAAGSYAAGFLSTEVVPNTALFQNALSYFAGNQLGTPIDNVTYDPLLFAKIRPSGDCNNNNNLNSSCGDNDNGHKRKTGFAELRGEFGWNYIKEDYHVGLNIQAAAPTGKRPNARFLFENEIGNGKHWELGAGFGAHYTMWRSEDADKSFSFIFEVDVTHLFKAKQTRTFDLKGKNLSRYMLAEKLLPAQTPPELFGSGTFPSTTGAQTAATAQILTTANTKAEYSPVANFSTRDVKVSIGAQGDLVAMFNYTVRGFSWDFGYNFWGMSREKINLSCSDDCDNTPFPANTWALKGDAQVFGFQVPFTVAPQQVVGLSATENNATIHAGTNAAAAVATITANQNPGIDNPQTAFATLPAPIGNIPLSAILTGTAPLLIATSIQPVYIAETDLDLEGAQNRGYSNKVFTHFNYTWTNRERWIPYLGAGVSAEFGSHKGEDCTNNNTPTTTNSCDDDNNHRNVALSQWAVWVKGGVSFH
jgi:hypothetical protein